MESSLKSSHFTCKGRGYLRTSLLMCWLSACAAKPFMGAIAIGYEKHLRHTEGERWHDDINMLVQEHCILGAIQYSHSWAWWLYLVALVWFDLNTLTFWIQCCVACPYTFSLIYHCFIQAVLMGYLFLSQSPISVQLQWTHHCHSYFLLWFISF